jgi:hypothetical protein
MRAENGNSPQRTQRSQSRTRKIEAGKIQRNVLGKRKQPVAGGRGGAVGAI